MGKILSISLNLNVTPNTLGGYVLNSTTLEPNFGRGER